MHLRDVPFLIPVRGAMMTGSPGELRLNGIAMQLVVDTFQRFQDGSQKRRGRSFGNE